MPDREVDWPDYLAGFHADRTGVVVPSSEDWDTVAPQLANKRLNGSGTAEEQVARWAQDGCAVVRLTPAEETPTTSPDLPDASGAATPRETPARVEVKRPFKLHRVRKRKT